MDHEIVYERDIHKSYMKIPSLIDSNFDEKIILSKAISGVIPVKKHFVENIGQYWYDISGKQALDSYCNVNTMDASLVERLMIQILNLLEELEWNLIDVDCLCLRSELIFMNVVEMEFFFTLYPSTEQNIFQKLQEFMEYILTKLDHSDTEGVYKAYRMYEYILKDDYTISDLRNLVLEGRTEENVIEKKEKQEVIDEIAKEVSREEDIYETSPKDLLIEDKVTALFEKVLNLLKTKWAEKIKLQKDKKEKVPEIVYPDDELEEKRLTIHPTVCLASMDGIPRGQLMYEGIEHFPDYDIGQLMCMVGKSHRVKLQIDKDTISQFHAKIDWKNGKYYIEDMNSTNGTFLNEEMLNYKECRELQVGDIIRFADVKYRFL